MSFFGAKPNLITCIAEIFLSEGLEDRLLSALEIRHGMGRIKARKIFSSKYIQFHNNGTWHMWHIGTVSETHPEGCLFEPRHDLFRNTIFVSCGITNNTNCLSFIALTFMNVASGEDWDPRRHQT